MARLAADPGGFLIVAAGVVETFHDPQNATCRALN
jgi:hypothetical protein